MISCGGCQLNSEEVVEFPCEFCNELRALIGNHLSQKPMQFPGMCKEQVGHSKGHDWCVCWNEVGHLTHGVHDIHDCIVAMRLQELDSEVNADGVPTELWDREWS